MYILKDLIIFLYNNNKKLFYINIFRKNFSINSKNRISDTFQQLPWFDISKEMDVYL